MRGILQLNKLEMPLLLKDLIQRSNRKRTYIVRFFYALGIVLIGLYFFQTFWMQISTRGMVHVLGSGEATFYQFMILQALGLFIFTPVLVGGVIYEERQAGTLALLLTTPISGMRLVFEKLLSGLMPALMFLLIGAPFAALLIAMGGVSTRDLVAGYSGLLWLVINMAGLTLWLSATRSAMGSILGIAYLLPFVFFFSIGMIAAFGGESCMPIIYVIFPPIIFYEINVASIWVPTLIVLAMCVAVMVAWLLLVRKVLWKNIELKENLSMGRHLYKLIFDWGYLADSAGRVRAKPSEKGITEDQPTEAGKSGSVASSVRQGSILGRLIAQISTQDQARLPGDNPLAWQSTRKYGIHHFAGVAMVLGLFLGLGLLGLFFWSLDRFGTGEQQFYMSMLILVMHFATMLILPTAASSIFSEDRRRQTLASISVLPVSGFSMVWSKLAGPRRLAWILSISFMAICFVEMITEYGIPPVAWSSTRFSLTYSEYLLYSMMVYTVQMHAFWLLGAAISGLAGDRASGAWTATIIMAWAIGPFVFGGIFDLFGLAVISPLSLPWQLESGDQIVGDFESTLFYGIAVPICVMIISLITLYVRAERMMGRVVDRPLFQG